MVSDQDLGDAPTPLEDVDIHDDAFLRDPFTAFSRLRQGCPVARCNAHGGFWLLSRHDDVRRAAVNWRDFTSSVPGVTAIPIITPRTEPMLPIEIDPPHHSRYRALVNPLFSHARIEEIQPRIDQLVRKLLAAMTGGAHAAEAVQAFCIPVAISSLAAFTDVPLEDSDVWTGWITRMFDISDREAGTEAGLELVSYVRRLIARRRAEPRDDFLSCLIGAEIDGQRLDDQQICSFMTVIFGAGYETTADGLSSMLHWLATHPQDLRRIAADPGLIPTAIEEFLRYASPIQVFGRNATHDIEIHGRRIPAGDIVALAFGSANRDPDVFEAADELRLDRRPNRHLAFGAGPHLCPGADVARMELTLTLKAFADLGICLGLDPERPAKLKRRGDRYGYARLPLILTTKASN